MASSSTYASQLKYDVFLSFRGMDTCNNIVSHFYTALHRKGISVFIDADLKKGDDYLSLMKVIEQSKILIIIFSENYASSTWCLDELALIIKCKNQFGRIVIPVFYHINPSDVRRQTGNFAKAFTSHEEHFTNDKVHVWRNAMIEAASLSGWLLDGTKSESILLEKIIQDILKRLNDMFTNDYNDLVGVESVIEEIGSSFWMGSNDVCTIGIWGFGGIGKTAIASAIYNKMSSQFESSYFTQNVRKESDSLNGIAHMRGKLLSAILDDDNFCKGTLNMENSFVRHRLHNKKVFIVFDDVTSFEQIELLIGDLECLGFGSRIIITTRDKQVLRNCGVDRIHHIKGLADDHALKLFCQYAFKQGYPFVEYTELSNKAVRYAKGVPLALKVLGCNLQNRQRQYWESALDEFRKSSHTDILNVLKISFDGLDNKTKDLFLDIACFFKRRKECFVKEILDACGLHAQIGLPVLIDKALIATSNNKVIMHDLLQEMGRQIVKQESLGHPGECSRLWRHNDIYHVLRHNMGTSKIRGIRFDMFIKREIHLSPYAFSNMPKLMFLIVKNSNKEKNNKLHGFHRLKSDFGKLRYLCWHEYPERSLPLKFHPKCLAILRMRHSNLEQLWTGVVNLANLKFMDLSFSKHLLRIPDLSFATNLENLILEDCTSLLEIMPPSIQNVNSLINLNLRNCKSLTSLPIGIQSKSLRFVILSGCSNLMTAPNISCNMEQLCLDGSGIKEFSSLIEYPPKLDELNLENCSKLECLPNNFCQLKSLQRLNLRGCSNLKTISDDIGKLQSLIYLDTSGCSRLDRLPKNLANLQSSEVLETNDTPIRYVDEKEVEELNPSTSQPIGFALSEDEDEDEPSSSIYDDEDELLSAEDDDEDESQPSVKMMVGSTHDWPSMSSAASPVLKEMAGSTCDGPSMSSITSLDLNEMIESTGMETGFDTSEPRPKRLKICNYKNNNRQLEHDVCLSFSGETHNNFTSHLLAALNQAKIETVIDNEDDKLMNAIEKSRISIIIFSKGYFYSKGCLEELVQILECKKKYGQAVIPIFYNVDRSHVIDVSKNLEFMQERPEMLMKWRIALSKATDLDGFSSNFFRCESDLVEVIVKRVLEILNLVGVQSSIKKIVSLLHTCSKDVGIVGIWGESGIGKTTTTKALFDEIKIQFEGSYFALNVSEEFKSLERQTLLRQELYTAILKDGPSALGHIFTKQRLGGYKKVLIVLDDVTSLEQITFLIGDLNCLGLGSRIIITTRDRHVLKNSRVADDNMYKIDALSQHDALKLFSWYAFQQYRPPFDYDFLSKKVIDYAKGIPLAVKVLGAFLRKKKESEWGIVINNLEGKPCKDIRTVLEVSYEGLDDYEKNIFLDIACFLKWECRDFIIKFLNLSGFFAEIGMSVLLDRCLITISNNRITMNSLLQEMALKIVQEECGGDPSKRSRLWDDADIDDVLKNNMGNKAIEGICLDMSKIAHANLNSRAFSEMYNLRFLKLYNSHCEENSINKLWVTEDLEFFFTELSYLCWHGCPLKSLQSNLENLVALDMPYSDIQQLWTGDQILFHLKSINLSHSKHLEQSPDFSLTPNLESLILEGCTSLLEISSSINCLNKLVVLNLRQCKSLHSLPTSIDSRSLRRAILSSCSNLEKFPKISSYIEELFLDGTEIKELLLSIENPSRLVTLNFKNCSRLESLPSNLSLMKSLEHLNLSGCSNLDGLPDSLGHLQALKVLKAERLAQREVPSSIECLQFLKELNLTDCGIVKLPGSLEMLSSLESLFLGRNNFERIPATIFHLPKLFYLDLSYCERLQFLPLLPIHLQYVDASSCTSLEESSFSTVFFRRVEDIRVSFINCFKLEQNPVLYTMEKVLRNLRNTESPWCPTRAYICLPGNQIPEWFTFQIIGASVSSKQTLGELLDTESVSFAVCAVVEFGNYQEDGHGLVVRCACKLGNRDGRVVLHYGIPPDRIDSEHIFLGYDLHMCNFDFDDNPCNQDYEVSIQFYVEDLNGKRIDCCEVKKCGFYLFFHHIMRDDDDDDNGVSL